MTSKVFFDVTKNDKSMGQIVMELYDDVVPKTAANFRELCLRRAGEGFKKSQFHRIIKGFMAQRGDFTAGNGTGRKSIYGMKFADENLIHKHTGRGILSMANAGPNTNGSQFFICFEKTSWLDGKHVVFGRVVQGMDVLKEIEACGSDSGKPNAKIVIENCGEIQ